MAVDTNFAAFFSKLKVEEYPSILPPKTWESIPSQNASTASYSNAPQPPLLHESASSSFALSEASLVRLALNALLGSALISIQKLSDVFSSKPADRTFHRIPNLWTRSISSQALGKILNSIAQSGCLVFFLWKFVDNFKNLNQNSKSECNQSDDESDRRKEESPLAPSYSLVNQAFGASVGKVLEGYISSLDTLHASIGLRRSSKSVDRESYRASCFTSVVHSEVTLLEVYLHTKELRTQIEALGNICHVQNVARCFSVSSLEELTAKATLEFSNFYRGGDLLTYLYTQLQVADPAHHALLKFLFLRSCEPYCGFIRSWIYKAEISDPYKEFMVKYADNGLPNLNGRDGIPIDFPLASIRDGVAVPCFLKNFLIPIVRAGQQLQVLKKLLELCNHVGPKEYTSDDFLPSWRGHLSNHIFCSCPLTFSKGYLESLVIARKSYYENMQEKITNLLSRMEFEHRQVVPHGAESISFDANGGKTAVSFVSGSRPLHNTNFDDSFIKDDFYVFDASESSECSSLSGSGEQVEVDHADSLVEDEQRYLSSLRFSMTRPIDSAMQKPMQSGNSYDIECYLHKNSEENDSLGHSLHVSDKERTLGRLFLPPDLEVSNSLNSPFMFDRELMDSPMVKCRSLGRSKSPLYYEKWHSIHKGSDHCDASLKVTKTIMGVPKEGLPFFSKMTSTDNCLIENAFEADRHENGNYNSSLFTSQPWKFSDHGNFLSRNPMLRKNSCFHLTAITREKGSTSYGQSLPCFDFSIIEDPCKLFVEKFATSLRDQFGCQLSSHVAAPPVSGKDNYKGKQGCDGEDALIDNTKACFSHSPLHSKEQDQEAIVSTSGCGKSFTLTFTLLRYHEQDQEAIVSTSGCGKSSWESLLGSFSCAENRSAGNHQESLSAMFEIPLDFVIDKGLLQEILFQYKYVSRLAIKLFEKGFHLQEHLLALRRYYFMESADWADLIIMSLWHHKWCVAEAEQRLSEIQGFLEASVQRSSCDRDPNMDRLFVYNKWTGTLPLSPSAIGVHSFNFLGLGYRVDWPVTIVLTPSALKVYTEIFSFLIHVKLAVFSLTDIWRSLKDMKHLIARNHHSAIQEREVHHVNMLIKMRHQVNHFISTLQQYVMSQLSHVSWCKFLHSLEHKVKDMMDLEYVHLAYLTDSLHICFLSDETRPVALIIESILQCAFDFRSCLTGGMWGRIRETCWVLATKQKFEKNLKQLHLCYLKSPKHVEFGLSRFWGYLNYNDYNSDVGNGMNLYAF